METFLEHASATGVKSPHSQLRTVDVARRSGYSVQQIRNLERDGALPPAVRSGSGYRGYAEIHVRAALAYRQLAAGVGPIQAKLIMRTAHRAPPTELIAALDAAHARLHAERLDLAAAREAVAAIAAEPIQDVRPADDLTITQLALALDVRPSTLRHWDGEGLLQPHRITPRGPRVYSPYEVRNARIIHQLRQAGYGIAILQQLLPALRTGRRWDEVTAALTVRETSIETRSRALFDATAALHVLLEDAPTAP